MLLQPDLNKQKMRPSLEKRYILAACLIHVHRLENPPAFDFSTNCHAFAPCLNLLPASNNSNQTQMMQLPYEQFNHDNYMLKCQMELHVEMEAVTIQEITNLRVQ